MVLSEYWKRLEEFFWNKIMSAISQSDENGIFCWFTVLCIYADVGGCVDLKKPITYWRNTWMVPNSMSVIKVGTFFLKCSWRTHWTLLFLHLTSTSGSYGCDFAYRLYPSLLVKMLKIGFSPKALERFFWNSGFK